MASWDQTNTTDRASWDAREARVEYLEATLRAALSYIQERHITNEDKRTADLIALVRGALRKERD